MRPFVPLPRVIRGIRSITRPAQFTCLWKELDKREPLCCQDARVDFGAHFNPAGLQLLRYWAGLGYYKSIRFMLVLRGPETGQSVSVLGSIGWFQARSVRDDGREGAGRKKWGDA